MANEKLIRLFKSRNVEDILKFYDHFDGHADLIKWLKEYPYAPVKFHETDDESDVVIVVTTPDHNSKHASECKRIFRGLKIVFAESSGKYFDFSRSANMGLKRALTHKPKWVVLSNDDMFKIDGPEVLKRGLDEINPRKFDVVFRKNENYTRTLGKANMGLIRLIGNLPIDSHKKKYLKLLDKFNADMLVYSTEASLMQRAYTSALMTGRRLTINSFQYPHIFSGRFIKGRKCNVFDEIYRNGMDDIDLDLYVNKSRARFAFMDYNIGQYGGMVLGRGMDRIFRDVANAAYFSYKVRKNRWI